MPALTPLPSPGISHASRQRAHGIAAGFSDGAAAVRDGRHHLALRDRTGVALPATTRWVAIQRTTSATSKRTYGPTFT